MGSKKKKADSLGHRGLYALWRREKRLQELYLPAELRGKWWDEVAE